MLKLIILCALLLSFNAVTANENNQILPEPLSFSDALSFADKNYHYSLRKAKLAIDESIANGFSLQSKNDLDINLEGYFREVGVSDLGDDTKTNDSKVSLVATKNIYDFGYSSNTERLSDHLRVLKESEFELEKKNYLNKVVVAYFNVLKSDNNYLVDNENMSIAFIRFDRAQEKAEFGLTSDLDILEAQTNYEVVRQQRYASEAQQRFTRQILAELLGASNLPDVLEVPKINVKREIIEDVELLSNLAMLNSLESKLQYAKLQYAKQSMQVASTAYSPTIDAEFELSEYARDSAFRDKWRASINFNIPLYKGNRADSASMAARIRYQSTLSEMQQVKSTLRLKVLNLWQSIKLKTMMLSGAIIKQEYRDIYLEQSRANYEMEYKSDLGDSMVQFSRSRAERYALEFDLESAWRELISLVGKENLSKIIKSNE